MCLSFLDNSLGAHEQIIPHFPSRDPLYLCCRTPSAKDAAPPGAKRENWGFFGRKVRLIIPLQNAIEVPGILVSIGLNYLYISISKGKSQKK